MDREYFDKRFDKLEQQLESWRNERIAKQEATLSKCQTRKAETLARHDERIEAIENKPRWTTIAITIFAFITLIITIIINVSCAPVQADPPVKTVLLTWTAPLDNVGVTGYEVRLSIDSTLFYTDWNGLDSVHYEGIPKQAGQTESLLVDVGEGTWFFNVRAFDAAGNLAQPSNSAMRVIDITIPERILDLDVDYE